MVFYMSDYPKCEIIQTRFMKIVVARESHDQITLCKILETDNTFEEDVVMSMTMVSRRNDCVGDVTGYEFVVFLSSPSTGRKRTNVFGGSLFRTPCAIDAEDE